MCFSRNASLLCCCRQPMSDSDNRKSFNSSDNEIVLIERRYGCYRLGIFAAIIIVLLLILGTIPVTLTIKNNKIVLICLCVTLGVVAILLSLFIVWQQRHAKHQRELSARPYVLQVHNQNGLYTSVPTSTSTRTSWLFWNNSQQKNRNLPQHPLRSPSIQHNPTKISKLQDVSDAPRYTTIV